MDRRTILAVVLCVVVYYAWMMWVQATTPIPVEEASAEVEAPAPTEPVAIPEAPVEPVASTSGLPVRTGRFDACGSTSEWTSDGGVLRDVHLDHYQAPYHVKALWQYAVDFVTGSSEPGGWKPYGDPPGPVVMLTACATEQVRERAARERLAGFFFKPCPPDALAAELRRLCGRTSAPLLSPRS